MVEGSKVLVREAQVNFEGKPNELKKIREFASSKTFTDLSPQLKETAIFHSVFFATASDQIVNAKLKDLYTSKAYAGFNHHEKQTFGSIGDVIDQYLDLYNTHNEKNKLSKEKIAELCRKEKRIDVAARVARLDFAKTLGYLPGKEGNSGPKDYVATTLNPQFQLAEKLVREAVNKFSK